MRSCFPGLSGEKLISITGLHVAPVGSPVHRPVSRSHGFPTSTELLESLCISSRIDPGPGPKERLRRCGVNKECHLVLTQPFSTGMLLFCVISFD